MICPAKKNGSCGRGGSATSEQMQIESYQNVELGIE